MARYKPKAKAGNDPSVQNAFREVYANTPKNVTATGKTGAAKRKMMAAIAFSKAGRDK